MSAQRDKLHQIKLNVDNDAALIFQHRLVKGGSPLTIISGANQIIWGYTLLTHVQPTYGGEVQQILGARIENMVINGNTRDNNQLEEIYDWFRAYMTMASGFGFKDNGRRSEVPIVFSYPARKWQFDIQVIDASGFQIGTGLVATPWQITANVVPTGYDQQHALASVPMNDLTSVLIPATGIPVGIGYLASNPFSDAAYGGLDLAESGKTIGSNFQRLIGAWSVGDFAHFGFDGSAPTAYNALNVDSKDYWTSIYGTDFISRGSVDQNPSGAQASGDPGSPGAGGNKGTSTGLSDTQNTFVNRLAQVSNFDFGFITTWLRAEEGKLGLVPAATVNGRGIHQPSGDYNYLNIFGSDGNFDTPSGAADFTWKWLTTMSDQRIRDMATSIPGKDIIAAFKILGESPWDVGHYGDPPGNNLINLWNSTYKATVTYANAPTGGGKVVPPQTGSIRAKAIAYANWALAHTAQISYAHTRPNSSTPLALPFSTDCSGSVCMFYLWSGANNVGATYTGDMLTRLTHITADVAAPGDMVVVGSGTGHHAVMLLNKVGNDWNCFSHGGPGGPHTSPLSYYLARDSVTYLRWPGNIDDAS